MWVCKLVTIIEVEEEVSGGPIVVIVVIAGSIHKDYGEVAPHAYSGPGRTCSPRFSHVRTIFAPYSQAEISSEVV